MLLRGQMGNYMLKDFGSDIN